MFRRRSGPLSQRLLSLRDLRRELRSQNEALIRGLCANAFLGDDRVLCRVLGRYKMIVDANDLSVSAHLLMDGYWEMWLTEIVAELVKPGMTVADIGANVGYFTILMADLVGSEGKVLSYEVNPAMVRKVRQSVVINGFSDRVSLHEQALADSEGAYRLNIPKDEPGGAHLVPADPAAPDVVLARRLDSFPEAADVDMLKIDADGSEWAIWLGMSGLLESTRLSTIFLEFTGVRYPYPWVFLDAIADAGFSFARVSLDDGVIATTRDEILAGSQYEDMMLLLRR